jgi:hypothetical protein
MTFTEGEIRYRVVYHFPKRTREQAFAFDEVIEYVEDQRERPAEVTGYTQTHDLEGQWWSDSVSGWVDDTVSTVTVDYLLCEDEDEVNTESFEEREDLVRQNVAEIKAFAHSRYALYGSPQDEIWIVGYEVTRFL